MPIIGGVNSTPSTEADPTHPNASLFCKQYNDLIDDLEGKLTIIEQPPLLNSSPLSDYNLWNFRIDSVNGDDANTGVSGAPIRTFERLHELIEFRKAYYYISVYLTGNFTNPDLDFTRHPFFTRDLWSSLPTPPTIYVMPDPETAGCTITVDNIVRFINSTALQFIRSKIKIQFYDLEFIYSNNQAVIYLNECDVVFINCTFSRAGGDDIPLIAVDNSKIILQSELSINSTNPIRHFLAGDSNDLMVSLVNGYHFMPVSESNLYHGLIRGSNNRINVVYLGTNNIVRIANSGGFLAYNSDFANSKANNINYRGGIGSLYQGPMSPTIPYFFNPSTPLQIS